MLADSEAIEEFIPHRPPMRLVHSLLECSAQCALAGARVDESWPTFDAGQVEALLLVEVLAQTAALMVGYNRRHEEKMGGRGWLVGVRHTELSTGPLAQDTELRSQVELSYQVENYAVYQGRVEDMRGRVLARAELQTYQPRDFNFMAEE